jgi:glycosyltransferase involved in cell wall biosynthesis
MSDVSVVTPFYNTADYLEECIRSVLAQTRADFEYILVDNCSTDGSGDIAQGFADKDPRIRLIRSSTFRSQMENFNFSLEQISAHSRYTKMVLADDWIFPRCLEEMIALADCDPTIGIVSSYRLRGDDVQNVGVPAAISVMSGRDACRRQLLLGHHYIGSHSSVLYRSELVRSRAPFYPYDRLHPDTETAYEILRAWSFGFVHQVLSFTRIGNPSVNTRIAPFEPQLLDRLMVLARFGQESLSESEFVQRWDHYERAYLRLLARHRVQGTGPDFWAYHHRGQATIGYTPPKGRLLIAVLAELLRLLRHPKALLAVATARIRAMNYRARSGA